MLLFRPALHRQNRRKDAAGPSGTGMGTISVTQSDVTPVPPKKQCRVEFTPPEVTTITTINNTILVCGSSHKTEHLYTAITS